MRSLFGGMAILAALATATAGAQQAGIGLLGAPTGNYNATAHVEPKPDTGLVASLQHVYGPVSTAALKLSLRRQVNQEKSHIDTQVANVSGSSDDYNSAVSDLSNGDADAVATFESAKTTAITSGKSVYRQWIAGKDSSHIDAAKKLMVAWIGMVNATPDIYPDSTPESDLADKSYQDALNGFNLDYEGQ